jgi:hypothetical protein
MAKREQGVSKLDLLTLIRDMERTQVRSAKLRKLEEEEEKAGDVRDDFLENNREYKALDRKCQSLHVKVRELRQKEQVERNAERMRVKALVRTEGASPEAIAAVKAFAKRFGVL